MGCSTVSMAAPRLRRKMTTAKRCSESSRSDCEVLVVTLAGKGRQFFFCFSFFLQAVRGQKTKSNTTESYPDAASVKAKFSQHFRKYSSQVVFMVDISTT